MTYTSDQHEADITAALKARDLARSNHLFHRADNELADAQFHAAVRAAGGKFAEHAESLHDELDAERLRGTTARAKLAEAKVALSAALKAIPAAKGDAKLAQDASESPVEPQGTSPEGPRTPGTAARRTARPRTRPAAS